MQVIEKILLQKRQQKHQRLVWIPAAILNKKSIKGVTDRGFSGMQRRWGNARNLKPLAAPLPPNSPQPVLSGLFRQLPSSFGLGSGGSSGGRGRGHQEGTYNR